MAHKPKAAGKTAIDAERMATIEELVVQKKPLGFNLVGQTINLNQKRSKMLDDRC